jgi:hypothetical protein
MDDKETYLNNPYTVLIALCDTVECGMGCKTPVIKCIPIPNSPQQIWSDIIWFVNTYQNIGDDISFVIESKEEDVE